MEKITTGVVTISLVLAPAIALAAAPLGESAAYPAVASYADLLEPIPNAQERLKIAQAEDAARPPRLIQAQYYEHHHHHHHHNSWGPYYGYGAPSYYGYGSVPYAYSYAYRAPTYYGYAYPAPRWARRHHRRHVYYRYY